MKFQRWLFQHKNHITLISGLLILFAGFAHFGFHWPQGYQAAMIAASILGVLPIGLQAYQALRAKVVSIDLLVTIAVIGAFIIGEYNESAVVTFLFLFGAYLEQRTLTKTRSAIADLVKMAPTTATLLNNGQAQEIPIDDVEIGDTLLVKTGAQVPVDGRIISGEGHLNEASVTGEATLKKKTIAETVYAGTILENGTLQIQAEKIGEDTTLGKIIELVEEAQDTKSQAERFIDRFAKYYTPAVLLLAIVVGLLTRDIRLAVTLLVLGCPGALVIGVPVSSVAGIGNGAKNGVLIKGGDVLDTFSKVDLLAFDKTGTLTQGKPGVAEVKTYTNDPALAFDLTASVERESDHPLAKAVLTYLEHSEIIPITKTNVIKGQGIAAESRNHQILVGNEKLLSTHHISLSPQADSDQQSLAESGHSLVFVAIDGQLQLLFGIKDQLRPDAKETINTLRQMGIKKFVLLTGDNAATAQQVANTLQLDEVHSQLLPEDKADYLKTMQKQGHTVAFVGDGVNDSPSLALADIGIAMGSGTDVAIETSDVVLMQSKLDKLVHAHGLTKKTTLNMKENIGIALATVALLFLGLLLGYIYMASGMLIHEVSILIVILNGMRLLSYRPKKN